MKERGIIFNAEMVRAILDGRKTQTRRIMTVQPESNQFGLSRIRASTKRSDIGKYNWSESNATGHHIRSTLFACPFGVVRDRLWVRETFATLGNEDGCPIDWSENLIKEGGPGAARIYRASCEQKPDDYGLWSIPDDATWKPHTENMLYDGSWTPPIHMPRWASRITLEITDIRVERLQDISETDAAAEGVFAEVWDQTVVAKNYLNPDCVFQCWGEEMSGYVDMDSLFRASFGSLWQSIYGDESWQANPWVWVVEFKQLENDGEVQ